MTTLNDYLAQKRDAFHAKREAARAPGAGPVPLKANVRAEGRSGIRRIRIRDFQIVSDSPPDFAGYDLGPGSPEIALGALGSCLTHTFLIQASALGVPLESLDVEVTGQVDPRAGLPGHEDIPVYPHNVAYKVNITSPASEDEISALRQAVEKACPILNFFQKPQTLHGTIAHTRPAVAAAAAE